MRLCRPDFRDIAKSRAELRNISNQQRVPFMAVTATATPAMLDDIILVMRSHEYAAGFKIFKASVFRNNLDSIVAKQRPPACYSDLVSLLLQVQAHSATGIVYRTTRKGTEQLAAYLQQQGFAAACFHAGLPAVQKQNVLRSWQQDDVLVVVAMIAFGMGIDKASVRYVVHWNLEVAPSTWVDTVGRYIKENIFPMQVHFAQAVRIMLESTHYRISGGWGYGGAHL